MKERNDDFQKRREHLKNMSDEELKSYFLKLSDKIVDPLIDLAKHNTSKSIERSVLLRMGFSSIEAKAIVDHLNENDLLKKGAGHCVYVIAKEKGISIREAGLKLQDGEYMEFLNHYFEARK
jgi:D-ornithine 4,5-aminomutase subunit alpha